MALTILVADREERHVMAINRDSILVVEDDGVIAALLQDLLEEEGYHTLRAADGEAALGILRRNRGAIALILLDVLMPRMSGLAFRLEQRNDPLLAHIPVIVITTGAEIHPQMAPDAILHKPFQAEDLITLVARFVEPGRS